MNGELDLFGFFERQRLLRLDYAVFVNGFDRQRHGFGSARGREPLRYTAGAVATKWRTPHKQDRKRERRPVSS
jgi:hypothetical protein